MIGLLLGMRSAINWIQSIIFILGNHYKVVHAIWYMLNLYCQYLSFLLYFILTGTLDIMFQDLLPLLFILIG